MRPGSSPWMRWAAPAGVVPGQLLDQDEERAGRRWPVRTGGACNHTTTTTTTTAAPASRFQISTVLRLGKVLGWSEPEDAGRPGWVLFVAARHGSDQLIVIVLGRFPGGRVGHGAPTKPR
ncbi:hypothetical protein ACNTMW_31965 [Planosporangium sp. 12N6]|uniref:hypothetical protein n=1 Tax=Planosporangium spinosum TaxID=3402278 RepID=UPI003CEA8152